MGINKILYFNIIILFFACEYSNEEKVLYPNGNLKISASIKEGKWNGSVKYFYESGSLKLEQLWNNGQKDGYSRKYFKNGNIMKIDTFCLSVPCGWSIEYYESGKVRSMGNYKNGHSLGKHVFFYENGDTLEIDYYNKKGVVYDYEKYNLDGSLMEDKKIGFLFLSEDTVNIGEDVVLTAYMGNNQSKTRLIIGNDFDQKDLLKDTLGFYFPEEGADDGIKYEFKPTKTGVQKIKGLIQDRVLIGKYYKVRSIPFTYEYFVK